MKPLKQAGKAIVVAVLGWQVRRLLARHAIKTVGVVGSYGKTSTKFGIATVLAEHFRVRYQAGNYNDLVTVPLIFFGEHAPSLLNPLAWAGIFIRNERQLRGEYPYDAVVLELGTDGPGQIAAFQRYLQLDIAVVTAIAYEHMQFFTGLAAVAAEELAVQQYSRQVLYNADLCDARYAAALTPVGVPFGFHKNSQYQISDARFKDDTYTFTIMNGHKKLLEASYQGVAKAQAYSASAAAIIAHEWGMPVYKITAGIAKMQPVAGRMQPLRGIRGSTILDDTYNSSPSAARAALDVLYNLEAPQKIAVLGSMNELGDYSETAHTEIGEYCDPKQLDVVITLGPDANTYLAPAAAARGCVVHTCTNAHEAGEYLEKSVTDGAIILAKGSETNVYAEEAIKYILANPADASRLVRQSPVWLKRKHL